MKTSFLHPALTTFAALGLAALGTTQAHAQTTIVAYNFDNGTSGSTATAAMPSVGTATFTNNFKNPTADVAYVAGETSAATDTALRLNAGANGTGPGTSQEEGSYIQFSFDATGYNNLAFQYDTQRSTSGFSTQQVSYSSDGVTFTPVTASMISQGTDTASTAPGNVTINSNGTITPPVAPSSGTGYGTAIYNFSGVSALSNSATDIFRITFTGSAGTGSTTANDRIDNLSISGAPLASAPEPSGFVVLFLGAGALGLAAIRRRRIAL